MKFPPTPEQQAILDGIAENKSMMIEAMAGCAKTTTLTMMAQQMTKVNGVRPSLALAFNVKIKEELEKQFPTYFKVQTMNGLGHGAWMKTTGKRPVLDSGKLGKILKEFLSKLRMEHDPEGFASVLQLVKRARMQGLVPKAFIDQGAKFLLDDSDASWEAVADSLYIDLTDSMLWAARAVLSDSIHTAYKGVIDFDDQIYMPTLFGGVYSKYPEVLLDEAQDLSPLNHMQLAMCALDRLSACGDTRQAVYAFRGADSSSMDSMRSLRKAWLDFPLSVTFRCPKLIVARQQSHAPGYTAAPSAPDGVVEQWENWDAKRLAAIPGKIAILCRNNAPLMACALRLIRSGIGCTVLGREIGTSLIALSRKLIPEDGEGSAECARRVSDWRDKEVDLARLNDKEEKAAIILDKAECLFAVLANVGSAGELRSLLNRMFASENNRITLATGHKSKGLEWPTVIHLDSFRIPSKFAKMQKEQGNLIPMQQEMNLKYVIETRSQNTLIMANLDEMAAGE